MNLSIKYTLIVITLFIVSGCIPDEEEKQKGSLNAVSLCIKKNEQQSELVSKEFIKNQCISKHEQFRPHIYDKRNQAKVSVREDSLRLNVTSLVNNFPNFVVTSVEIEGFFYGSDGVRIAGSKWISDLWIEPNSSKRLNESIPVETKNNKDIDEGCYGLEEFRNCWGWNIKGFRGLEIKLE